MWLVLKARDEANRALRSFTRNVRGAGDAVAMAHNQAARASVASALAEARLNQSMMGTSIQRARLLGASEDSIRAMRLEMLANRDHINSLRGQQVALERAAQQLQLNANAADLHARRLQYLSHSMTTVSQVATSMGFVFTGVGVITVAAMNNMVKTAVEYQRQVALTSTQVDGFKATLEELSQIGLKVARNIAVPFEQIQPALFDIFSSTKANLAESELLLIGFAKAAVAGQTTIEAAGRGTIAIMNALNIPLKDVNKVLDIQFQLVRKGVGTYEEFARVFGRITPSANRAGQSFETVAGMLAFLTRNGLTAAMAAASGARALDAMSNPKTVERLGELGVQVRDIKGNFRPLVDVLSELRVKLNQMPPADRVKTLVEILKGAGGTIQARRFIEQVLLKPGELEEFKGFLTDMAGASGQFEAAYKKMANTAASSSQLLSNRWKAVKEMAGEALIPTFIKVVNAVGQVLEWFNKLSPQQQKLLAVGAAIAAGFTALLGVVLLLVGGLAAFIAVVATAGTSLLIVGGVLAGVIAAFAGLGAGIIIAWQRSAKFRDMLISVKDAIVTLWKDVIVPFVQDIVSEFEKNLVPSLSKLWKLIKDEVIPAFADWVKFMFTQVLPKVKETARIIADLIGKGFALIGSVLNNVIIPAWRLFNNWIKSNQDNIRAFMPIIIQLAKWFAIIAAVITGVLVVVMVGPLVLAILAVGAAFTAMIIVINTVIGWIRKLINWFKTEIPKALHAVADFFVSIWNSVAEFFIGVWQNIIDFLSQAWAIITGIILGALGFLRGIWETFWSVFGGLIKSVWGLIVAIIRLAFTIILALVLVSLKILYDAWSATWQAVKLVAVAVWTAIASFFKTIWSAISGSFKAIWTGISAFMDFIWGKIGGRVKGTSSGIRDFLAGIWRSVSSAVSSVWSTVYTTISTWIQRIYDKIAGIFEKIVGFFANAGTWLFDAGARIIRGLIDGMTSMVDKVTNKIDSITKKIRDHLPFSPAKTGPLSGRGNPYYSGQSIVKLIAQGMTSQLGTLIKASSRVASMMGTGPATALPGLMGGSQAGGTNQNFTIYTQEINPRRHAAELGFLLGARP